MIAAPIRVLAPLAVLLAGPSAAFAQAAVSATALASAQILEPAGIAQAAGGSDGASVVGRGSGLAQVSGGSFSIQGAANQVVSVTAIMPTAVQRAGGEEAIQLTGTRGSASRILNPQGAAAFDVAGAAPTGEAAGGFYAGSAQVLINLN